MIKFTILLKRRSDMSYADFVRYHQTVHAPLFMSTPVVKKTVRHYIQQHVIPGEIPGMAPVKYDGITELWFDNIASLRECFSDPIYLENVRPDEMSFLDLHGCDFIISSENKIC